MSTMESNETTLHKLSAAISDVDNGVNSFIDFVDENFLLHYDLTNSENHNLNSSNSTSNQIFDLSGYGNDGFINNTEKVFFDSSQQSIFFNGLTSVDGMGLYIKNINYVSGNSDQLEEITIEARIKLKSQITSHPGDERIIMSFDRSANFRFSVGSDIGSMKSLAAGKLAFHFTNTDGTFDVYDLNYNGDLRDNEWHDVQVIFKANIENGLRFFVDGQLTYSDPRTYNPIGNHSEYETPR